MMLVSNMMLSVVLEWQLSWWRWWQLTWWSCAW